MKLTSLQHAIAAHAPDSSSVALGLQLEQAIPFAAAHEIIRQGKRDLTLIGPISDICFDQLIGAGCVGKVIAAWVGNAMMGSAYNFRRACEIENPGTPGEKLRVFNMTNLSLALALQAGAMGVPFMPTRTAMGTDVVKGNHFFYQIMSPFAAPGGSKEMLYAVRALTPDVTILHVQRADEFGNAHVWGNFGVLLEGVKAAKQVIVCAEEIVSPEIIASDPNRTVIPGVFVTAVCHVPFGAHPSPVQGHYNRDHDFFREYHEQTKTLEAFNAWVETWVYGVKDREEYRRLFGEERLRSLDIKTSAKSVPAEFGF